MTRRTGTGTGTSAAVEYEKMAAPLRRRLAEQLVAAGYVRSPEWRTALEATPRHLFLPEFFDQSEAGDGSPTSYLPVAVQRDGPARWLELVYRDETWVTQLDGQLTPGDLAPGMASYSNAVPTSSSSLPSLVVSMWEDLDVHDGQQVLEIGTGTGYSTALGCHRLGDDHVTSVEIDPGVAARAKAALEAAGYRPRLVVGDGLDGAPPGPGSRAPYDRLIATCALRAVPTSWIAQCRRGAIILVTLTGWLGASGLARLTVRDPAAGAADGAFIDPAVSFMPARSQAPGFVMIPALDDDTLISSRPAVVGPEIFAGSAAARWLIQLAAPNAQHLEFGPDQHLAGREALPEHMLVESDESYAAFHRSSAGGWIVRQGGRRALWDTVEHAVARWRDAGEPALTDLRLSVTADWQTIAIGTWEIPISASPTEPGGI
jgi:methyltransferase of ATP-grasp peptide maturase system